MNDSTARGTPAKSLRQAVIVALALGVMVWVAASYAIARNILVDSMVEHELDDGTAQGQRLLRLVDVELARIDRTSRDWAAWDATWGFARGEDPHYVERNVNDDVLLNLKLDMMAVTAADGSPRLLRMRGANDPVPAPLPDLLAPGGAWLAAHSDDRPLLGLVGTSRGPFAFAAHPIHRSQPDAPGESAGTQVFGRFLDQSFVGELRAILGVKLTLHPPDDAAQPDVPAAVRQIDDGALRVTVIDDATLVTYVVLRDLWGQPVAVLRALTPRTAYAQARRAERGLLVASLAIGLFAGVCCYGFISTRVLAPLQRLDAAVLDVARDGGSARLPRARVEDEFARLGRSVNAMLDELDTQRDAREARDAAQLASRLKGEMLGRLGQATAAPLAELGHSLDEALRSDDLTPRSRALLDRAYRASFALGSELQGLPDFARDRRAEAAAPVAPFDLCDLLERMAETAAARAVARDTELVCDVDPALAPRYLGDSQRLQTAVGFMLDGLLDAPGGTDLLLRARLASAGSAQDSIDVSVTRVPRESGAITAPPAAGVDPGAAGRLQQMAAELGGLAQSTAGSHRLTLSMPRAGTTAPGTLRLHAGRRVLLVGAPRVARDILEAYLRAFGCQVTTVDALRPTTRHNVDLAVMLVDDAESPSPVQSLLPGAPTILVLPTGSPPPSARANIVWLQRPLRWSALRGALEAALQASPVS